MMTKNLFGFKSPPTPLYQEGKKILRLAPQNDWFDEKIPPTPPEYPPLQKGGFLILQYRAENSHNRFVSKSSILLEFREFDVVSNLVEL